MIASEFGTSPQATHEVDCEFQDMSQWSEKEKFSAASLMQSLDVSHDAQQHGPSSVLQSFESWMLRFQDHGRTCSDHGEPMHNDEHILSAEQNAKTFTRFIWARMTLRRLALDQRILSGPR